MSAGNMAPAKIGRYEVLGELGMGTLGMVYAGRDPASDRTVAIKTLLKSALDEETAADYSLMIRREARAGERLNHPNIVQGLDFGDDGDIAYVVTEFVEGRDLKSYFEAGQRFGIGTTVILMGELCAALHCAHEAGIVHRNLTPGSVMIDADSYVKLTDFSLALFAGAEDAEDFREEAGTLVGTPAYLSPEAILGEAIDRRADIFAAGVILYLLLTGQRPFMGTDGLTIARKIVQDDPPPPSSLNQEVSPHFDAVVAKALAKNAQDRYQTAQELDVALQGAMWKSGPGALPGKFTQEHDDDDDLFPRRPDG